MNNPTHLPPGPLSDLILAVAGKLLDHPNSKATLLSRNWHQAVGGYLSKHTEPLKLQNGILTVRVDSSAWLTELTFLTPEILQKLQNILPPGSLKGIRFKQESLRNSPSWLQQKTAPPTLPAPQPEEETKITALTAIITDPSVRTSLTRLLLTDMVLKRVRSTGLAPKSTPPFFHPSEP
ncbi:MAG: DUF721 domain-containing protein [Magnetococcales bacterium]|nr:DUF721 domain-containing protein [Magnetococcales bacterium]